MEGDQEGIHEGQLEILLIEIEIKSFF